MPRNPPLPAAPADEQLVLVDPADPSLAVPDFSAPVPAPAPEPEPEHQTPPLWWLRPDVPQPWLHRGHPATPGKTACNIKLNPHFRPATSAEVKGMRKCRVCVPRPAHAPKRAKVLR